MTKELIERLRDTASKGVSVWGDLQKDAADLIEAQKTKIALQKGLIDGLLIVKREIGNEREALAAELAAARAQEPVAYRYKFTHPISGEPVWRDSSPTWNGQCVQEVQPLFAAPVPPVREPLSDNTIAALRQAIAQPEACTWTETDDEDGIWSSSCGELWSFIDGGPKENRVSYCHNCGKKVEVKP